jgi:3-oxoacyl-[acyl-carrier protein] reductase
MDLGLHGRTVIVTGASGGIGRHIAGRFAAEGADVVLTYHSKPINHFDGKALFQRYELGDARSAHDLVEAALAWTGRIDGLVNNAVHWGSDAPPDPDTGFEELADEVWTRVLRDNIEGVVRLSGLVAPHMRRQRFGRLVHISSSIATTGMAGGEYYGAAKAALHGFSRSLAYGLGRAGDLLSNVVVPGLTRTETNTHIVEAVGAGLAAAKPLRRLLTADEVAAAVLFLGSAANTGITGQVIAVDGGA